MKSRERTSAPTNKTTQEKEYKTMTFKEAYEFARASSKDFRKDSDMITKGYRRGEHTPCLYWAVNNEMFYYGFDGVDLHQNKYPQKRADYFLKHCNVGYRFHKNEHKRIQDTRENLIRVANGMRYAELREYAKTSGEDALCHLKRAEGIYEVVKILESQEHFEEMADKYWDMVIG
jgi:hypothetical protein